MGSLSHVTVNNLTLFDFVDRLNSIYLPPLCALFAILFFGWVMPEDEVKDELSNHGTLRIGFYPVLRFLARYVVPLALLVVIVSGILS